MGELQAGVEQSLAALPQPSVLLQSSEVTLNDPALGHDLEGVQFAALANLRGDLFAEDGTERQTAPVLAYGNTN